MERSQRLLGFLFRCSWKNPNQGKPVYFGLKRHWRYHFSRKSTHILISVIDDVSKLSFLIFQRSLIVIDTSSLYTELWLLHATSVWLQFQIMSDPWEQQNSPRHIYQAFFCSRCARRPSSSRERSFVPGNPWDDGPQRYPRHENRRMPMYTGDARKPALENASSWTTNLPPWPRHTTS
jgi:hypothetical protein